MSVTRTPRCPYRQERCGIVHFHPESDWRRLQMAKPNYAFAKRQREIAKKQKKEEKRQLKTEAQPPPAQEEHPPQLPVDETTVVWSPWFTGRSGFTCAKVTLSRLRHHCSRASGTPNPALQGTRDEAARPWALTLGF